MFPSDDFGGEVLRTAQQTQEMFVDEVTLCPALLNVNIKTKNIRKNMLRVF